jgi:hypothetical protein
MAYLHNNEKAINRHKEHQQRASHSSFFEGNKSEQRRRTTEQKI